GTGQGLNQLNNINISHNTFTKAIRALAIFGGAPGQMHNWTVQDNLFAYGTYGFMSFSSGATTCDGGANFNNAYLVVQSCVSNWVWDHNSVFNWNGGTLGAKWPTNGAGSGNFFFTGTSGVGFANYGNGDSSFHPGNYALSTSSPLHNAASD